MALLAAILLQQPQAATAGILNRLTDNQAEDSSPAWSPDGGKIVFHSERSGNFDIWIMNTDGSGLTRLTDSPSGDKHPFFSPDGGKIVFHSDRSGNNDIYVMNADGSGQTALTTNGADDRRPAWSPDGTRIVFSSNRDGSDAIWVMDADGANPDQLTSDPATADTHPVFSHDGSRIAFSRFTGNVGDIWIMDADGANQTPITSDPANEMQPFWSPDDSRLLYRSDSHGNFDIWIMDADGKGRAQISRSNADDSNPFYSPDAGRIAFASNRSGNYEIWTTNVWTNNGPPGMSALSLTCSSTDSNTVLVGSEGGIYRSTDAGATWAYSTLRARSAKVLFEDTQCGAGVVTATWDTLWNSTDNGLTWSELVDLLNEDISALAMAPSPDCTGYIGTWGHGVFTSDEVNGLAGFSIRSLAVAANGHVYAGSEESGIYKSTNKGVDWTLVNGTVSGVEDLLIDSSGRIYAATISNGVLVSTNHGSDWTPMANGLPDLNGGAAGGIAAISLAKGNDGILYAGVIKQLFPLRMTVYRYNTATSTWIATSDGINGSWVEDMCVATDNTLYIATAKGVYKSGNSGATWSSELASGFSGRAFDEAPFVRNSSGTLLIGSEGNGMYSSTDNGAGWNEIGSGDPLWMNDLVVDAAGNLYGVSGDIGGVYRSMDDGATWQLKSAGLPSESMFGLTIYMRSETLTVDGNGRLYAGLENGRVYWSDDQAESWTAGSILQLFGNPGEIRGLVGGAAGAVYAITEDEGFFSSPDSGTTWTQKNNGLPNDMDLTDSPLYRNPYTGFLYLTAWNQSGILLSQNNGDSWENMQITGNDAGCSIENIAFGANGSLYASACGGAVHESLDNGATWTNISAGLIPYDNIDGIRISKLFSVDENTLLASTNSGGIYSIDLLTCQGRLGDAIAALQILSGMSPANVGSIPDIDGDNVITMADVIDPLQCAGGLR